MFRWGSGAHASPGPVDMRKPDEIGLSVAEGGRCDAGGRCMCPAKFMPSKGWILVWLVVLAFLTAVRLHDHHQFELICSTCYPTLFLSIWHFCAC